MTIHETIDCPVDPATPPPHAVRWADESVMVQDIEIRPRNIRFPYDTGGFGANLRAIILSLKYGGDMSEPKIREFLENFDVQKASLAALLDDWFERGNRQVPTAIEHAPAIVYDRQRTSVPVVETMLCDDAGQFKLLTEKLAWCWIHAGRHYAKRSPLVMRSCSRRFWIATETSIVRCKDIMRVRVTSRLLCCNLNLTNCFRPARATRRWTIGLPRRRPRKRHC